MDQTGMEKANAASMGAASSGGEVDGKGDVIGVDIENQQLRSHRGNLRKLLPSLSLSLSLSLSGEHQRSGEEHL
ncbi:hypothetical protein EYF80_048602 [Liparis tanakae]|uniref:Uncharacterized protein n=1 Tax=Liparis tanakae TaxID=230148 RepID=A0A4Z2FJZ0_9TELE|nr:hypothetical protein EYF80_048602 [Liparis tanakae]